MQETERTRRLFSLHTLLIGALVFTHSVHFAAAQTLQSTTTPLPSGLDRQCCGTITPEGKRLVAIFDGMDVEHLWLPKTHIIWDTGQNNPARPYSGHGSATHCSAFAAAVGLRLNVYMLRPPDHGQDFLASAQTRWFNSKAGENRGWSPVASPALAQELANSGNLVVVAYESQDAHVPGHIAVVRPAEKTISELNEQGVQVVEAGATNHNSFYAAYSFTHHPGAWPNEVRYYSHAVDWSSVEQAKSSRPDAP